MTESKISKTIELSPKFLDRNIKQHILQKIQSSGSCCREYGYIERIVSIDHFVNTRITDNGYCVFDVDFTAITSKPEIGKEIDSVISVVVKDGIFMSNNKHIKIFLPAKYLQDYTFDQKERIFKKQEDLLCVGRQIRVYIHNINFDNLRFECIASKIIQI